MFNAAIVRNPLNIFQIKSDRCEICRHILLLAKAKDQNADLIDKAEKIKLSITQLRNDVKKSLFNAVPKIANISGELAKQQSSKITGIKQLNEMIADKYISITKDLSQFCQDVIGTPPCKYAVVGMGSLARQEITPYSDFEHIILLSDDENCELDVEYFRWYSVIFHIVILNIGETIIPSLNIYTLNDKHSSLGDWFYDAITPRGVSFDGMMPYACKFPLGRTNSTKAKQFTTELIQPVRKMVEFLGSEANLKNGYHLADILSKTCYVFGNKAIFDQFVLSVQNYRENMTEAITIREIKQQVKEDLNKFSTRFRLTKLNTQSPINIKQLVYRSSTIFISALARKHNILANSSFKIVEEMLQKNKITQNTANKLHYAIAIACEIRLRFYIENNSQCDEVIDLKHGRHKQTFLDIVGTMCTINYFQIAYCLQCEIAKQLHFSQLHFYSYPQLINIAICLAIEKPELPNYHETLHKTTWNITTFDFDKSIEQLEQDINLNSNITHENETDIFEYNSTTNEATNFHTKQILPIAQHLKQTENYSEAIDFYQQFLNMNQKESNSLDIVDVTQQLGICLQFSDRQTEALIHLNKAHEVQQCMSYDSNRDRNLAVTLHSIGDCHHSMQQYEDALKFLNRALEIKQNTTLNGDNDRSLAVTLHSIGSCYQSMQHYEDALTHLNRALEIKQNTTLNADNDRNLAVTLHSIGDCHHSMQQYEDAFKFLNRALEIEQNTTLNADNDRNLAMTIHSIGSCHQSMQQYEDALTHLNRALEIKQNTTLNADNERNLAVTLHSIGDCHHSMQQYEDALKFLNRALEIEQNTTLNADNDRNLAMTIHSIGSCHQSMQQYEDALTHLNRALEIKQNTTLNADNDRNLAVTLHSIGDCHHSMQQYENAFKFLNRALEIEQNTTLNADNDRNLAMTIHSIGSCHQSMQQYENALTHLNRALEIKQNTTLNADNDRNLAMTIHSIGSCHQSMQQYEDALKHLNRALEIKQNTTLNADKDRSLAAAQRDIAGCWIGLHDCDKSWIGLEQSLKVFQNITLNEKKDISFAHTYSFMGECLMSKMQFARAH